VMLVLTVINQELVIPRIADRLVLDRDDPDARKDLQVGGCYEPNGVHIEGQTAVRRGLIVRRFSCVIPESVARNFLHLTASEAKYIPAGDGQHTHGWLLTGTTDNNGKPVELDHWDNGSVLEMLDPGKFFLHTQEVDFEALTRNHNWLQLASTLQLYRELQKPDSTRLAAIAVMFHMRLTRPILGMLLVFMGLSVILRDQNRNVFISAGMCLVLCGLFFGAIFASKQLGDSEMLSPALASWLPVLCFGPLAFVMFDAIHT